MTFYRNTLNQAAKRASVEFDRLVTVESLRSKSQSPFHSQPRWFVMAYMHATGRYSLPQIAKALQLKNHSSVLYGLRRAHGHDGKSLNLIHGKPTLWKKDHFVNMVKADFPELFIEESDWSFTSGKGWAA